MREEHQSTLWVFSSPVTLAILIVPTCVSMFSQPFVYVYVGSSVYCQIVCSLFQLPVYFKSEYEKKNEASTSVYSLFTFT